MSAQEKVSTAVTSPLTSDDAKSIAQEYAELGIDRSLEDGIAREIPIVNTLVGVARIGGTRSGRSRQTETRSYPLSAGVDLSIKTRERSQQILCAVVENLTYRSCRPPPARCAVGALCRGDTNHPE